MKKFSEQPAEQKQFQVADIADIEALPEVSIAEIKKKKMAFNDLIIALDRLIPTIKSESGSNSDVIDESIEREQDTQDLAYLASHMNRARDEMVRLGDKEEAALKKAA